MTTAESAKHVKTKDNRSTDENHGTGVGETTERKSAGDSVTTGENHGTSEPAR